MKTNDGMNTSTIENTLRTPEPSAVGVPPLAPASVIYALFEHMEAEHGLTLLESELTEIVRLVNDTLDERLRWWIANAEGIAEARGALFRAGENMAAELCQWCPHEHRGEVLRAWDAAAQPIRDMKAAISSPNDQDQTAAEPARCENCGKPAVRLTEDGINLCRECYALCPEDTPNVQSEPRGSNQSKT